jgi:hypothetical protein
LRIASAVCADNPISSQQLANKETQYMKTTVLLASLGLLCCAPAFAATDAECDAVWKQADTNSDGSLSGAEANRYAASMRVMNKNVPADGTISKDVFLENCKADVYATTAVDPGAPLEGANSFTEGQAQDRVTAAGYGDVSALTKDDMGIWRGTATKDGKSVKVAVDYKGNVVAN